MAEFKKRFRCLMEKALFELSAKNADVVPNVPNSQPAAATANAM
jgi:glutamine phosphoribosylpyrophosphate amidotransferase